MEQMSLIGTIQCLIKRSRCGTRKQAPVESNAVEEKLEKTHADAMSTQKHLEDCDGKSDSTESGDVSNCDSSECFEQATGSTFGMSETTESADFVDSGSNYSEQTESPSLGYVTAFRPPPGLELFAESDAQAENFEVATPPGLGMTAFPSHPSTGLVGNKLNAKAVPFVPKSSPMTLPVSSTWEDPGSSVLNYLTGVYEEKTSSSPVAAKPFSYVEQAVDRMTPEEVAKLRALLDTKEPVKQSISLSAMIVDEKPHCGATFANSTVGPHSIKQKPKVPSRQHDRPQQSGSTKQGTSRVVKPSETLQAARAPTTLDLEGQAETTLRSNLEELSRMDPARVLMLRKINKLGLRSPSMLKDYFSNFGTVERVMISHSRAKSIYNPSATRVRIAGLAFVVMDSAQEKQAVLDLGRDHVVQGVGICVYEFTGNCNIDNAEGTKVPAADDHDFNTLD